MNLPIFWLRLFWLSSFFLFECVKWPASNLLYGKIFLTLSPINQFWTNCAHVIPLGNSKFGGSGVTLFWTRLTVTTFCFFQLGSLTSTDGWSCTFLSLPSLSSLPWVISSSSDSSATTSWYFIPRIHYFSSVSKCNRNIFEEWRLSKCRSWM